MTVLERKWDCPEVHHTPDTGEILQPLADGTPATEGDGYSIEREIMSVEGCWSNCDVQINVPAAWASPGDSVQLRLYSFGPAGRTLLAQVYCDAAGMRQENGRAFGIVLSARGAANDGFKLVARTATTRAGGVVQMRVWGDNSLPAGVGNTPGAGQLDQRSPLVGALCMGYNDSLALPWQPLEQDASGALIVTLGGGGGIIVTGTYEPSDTQANPNDLVGVESFNMAWNVVTSQWARWPADEFNIPYVHISSGILTQDGGTAYLGNFLTGQTQNLNQHRVRGTGDWWLSRGGYSGSIPAADLDGITNSIATGVFYTDAGTPPVPTSGQGAAFQLADLTSLIAVTAANAGIGLRTQSHPVVTDGANYYPLRGTSAGALNMSCGNPFTVNANTSVALAPGLYPSLVNLPYASVRGTVVGQWCASGFSGAISVAQIDCVQNALGAAGFNASAPAPVDGGAAALQCDAGANLLVMQGRPQAGARAAPGQYSHTGVTQEVIKASLGNILSITATSAEATQQLFLQLHNKGSAPVNGDTAEFEWWLGSLAEPGSNVITIGRDFFSQAGCQFLLGIAWAVSTTLGTLTLPASFNGSVSGTFV